MINNNSIASGRGTIFMLEVLLRSFLYGEDDRVEMSCILFVRNGLFAESSQRPTVRSFDSNASDICAM